VDNTDKKTKKQQLKSSEEKINKKVLRLLHKQLVNIRISCYTHIIPRGKQKNKSIDFKKL